MLTATRYRPHLSASESTWPPQLPLRRRIIAKLDELQRGDEFVSRQVMFARLLQPQPGREPQGQPQLMTDVILHALEREGQVEFSRSRKSLRLTALGRVHAQGDRPQVRADEIRGHSVIAYLRVRTRRLLGI